MPILTLTLHLDPHERDRAVEGVEGLDDVVDQVLLGEGALDEVVLDLLVLQPAQEDAAAALERPTGATDLLVVGDG